MRVKLNEDSKIVIERIDEEFEDVEYEFENVDSDRNRIVFRKKDRDSVEHENILVLDRSNFTDIDRIRSKQDFEKAVIDFMRSTLKAHAPNLEL